jgi:predicted transcriptional regulator
MERDRAIEARMNQLRSDVAEGLEQARRGELLPGDEVFMKLRHHATAA